MDSSEERPVANDNEKDRSEEERISITLGVSSALHAKIKVAAAEIGVSMSEYLEQILEEWASGQHTKSTGSHPVTLEAIEQLRRLREQIAQENNGQFFEDSAELLHQQREKRTQQLLAAHDNSRNREGKPLTRKKLEKMLKVREEIIRDTNGRTFDDSTEIIRQMREERSRELGEL